MGVRSGVIVISTDAGRATGPPALSATVTLAIALPRLRRSDRIGSVGLILNRCESPAARAKRCRLAAAALRRLLRPVAVNVRSPAHRAPQ